MKTKLLTTLIIAGSAAASQFAEAADGQINFTGTVTAQTCTINGGTSGNFTVALPKVAASSLAAAGQTAGRTPFTISLAACTPKTGAVRAFFESPNTDAATGRLKLDAGGSSNVQIGLLNGSDQSPIKLGMAEATQNSLPATLADGVATLSYYAMYYATGAATAGAANSRVMYTIAYQ